MVNIKQNIINYFKNVDLILLLVPIISSIYGLVLIFSATHDMGSSGFITVQSLAIALGLTAFVLCSLINFEEISVIWKIVLLLNVLFIASLIVLGESGNTGNNSWIRFAGIGIQPAEIGKIFFIFTFAKHVSLVRHKINQPLTLIELSMHLLVLAAVIVFISDDAGMAISYGVIFVIMLFAAGLSMKWFLGGLVLAISSIPFIWNFVLGDYQKFRILVIFDPSLAPDTAYHANQSKIALGAGGFTGMGYMQGNQTQYGLLPEKHTDFIFSVAGEEFGFIGCMLIVLLLTTIILRLFYISFKCESTFSSLICAGIAGMLIFQTFQNIFMCLGLTPVIGLTLPFFSYGGTSIVTTFLAIGVAESVRLREKPKRLKK